MIHTGLYRGVCLGSIDPMGRGRIQVQVPALGGNSTLWAERCAAFGNSGTAAVAAGAVVWVAFEGGDVNYPVALGFKP
ncbi:MAG: hypothetical protein KDA49_15850 [Rhodospirillaceae bacterium]|nr:hypothetical protein [Rhodospirillaceae bacterium]MCA8933949.1 hypothetical protein [Rhodospirillaceae bacterium]